MGAGPGSAADLSSFYDALRSVGMKTEYLEKLAGLTPTSFTLSEDDNAAVFSVMTGKLKLQKSMAEPGTEKTIYELPWQHQLTLLHELTHAEYVHVLKGGFREPTATGGAGSPERVHYDAWAAWKADVRGQGTFVQYSNLKAEEVCGYMIEANIGEVLEAAANIIKYNSDPYYYKDIAARFGSLEKLADELVLPDGTPSYPSVDGHKRLERGYKFGERRPNAQFENKTIEYTNYDSFRRDLYARGLGLNAPKTTGDLIDRMNTVRTARMDAVRGKILRDRRASLGLAMIPRWGAYNGDRTLILPRNGTE